MNIFIGNLSYNVTEGDLRQAFEAFGQVAWIKASMAADACSVIVMRKLNSIF